MQRPVTGFRCGVKGEKRVVAILLFLFHRDSQLPWTDKQERKAEFSIKIIFDLGVICLDLQGE